MTPNQEGLIRNARASIEAAKLLRDNQFYNVAIFRAYYAMFCLAEAVLLIDGLSFSKHSGVASKFGELFAKTGRVPVRLHQYPLIGQADRHAADYRINTAFTEDAANEHIAHAEEFLQEALKLLEPP